MNNAKKQRPIQKNTDITKLDQKDLTEVNSNIFKNFKSKLDTDLTSINEFIFSWLRQIPSFAEFYEKNQKNFLNFEVIFPKGVLEKLKSGEYILNKKNGTNEFLAFVKDKKTGNIIKQLRLKEISETEKINQLLPALQNMAVINALSQVSNQLEYIEKKIEEIQKEFNNDRIGKIQSGYNAYLEAIQMNNKDNKREALFSAYKSISEGRSQLIESIKQRINNLEVGFWISLFKSLSSWKYRKSQEENIKELFKEFFYIQRSSQIILTIYQELNEPKSLIQSLAPFKNFLEYIIDDSHSSKINEWLNHNKNWKEISRYSLKTIKSIPDFNELKTEEIKLIIHQSTNHE